MLYNSRPIIILLLCSFIPLFAVTGVAAEPKVKDFFAKPLIGNPFFSDDGKHLAYSMHKENDDYAVVLLNLDTMESKSFMLAGKSSHPILWLDNDRLILFSVQNGYSLYSIKEGKSKVFNRKESWSMRILGARRDQPGILNVWFSPHDRNNRSGVAAIRPERSLKKLHGIVEERSNVKEWIELPSGEPHQVYPDKLGRIRGAIMYNKGDNRLEFHYRKNEDSPWTRLEVDPLLDSFLGYSEDDGVVYISHQGDDENANSIYRYEVAHQRYGEKVFGAPGFSLDGAHLARDYKTGKLQGIYYHNDGPATHWIDPEMQQVQERIDAKLPGRINRIIEADLLDTRFIVAALVDRLPTRYYVYFKDKDQLAALPERFPQLKNVLMRPMQVIHFQSRDGLRLPGYLTLPAKTSQGKKPPLVVLAHGGPWVRDSWGYNTEVQFLANRGYAVFQPNYRGSSGYTYDISTKDEFDFRAMHDDVTDGVKLLKRSNLIDPDRVAIMGASFGGYLAIAGAAFEPDLYRCAVTIVGVFDWKHVIGQRRANRFDRFNYDILKERLGSEEDQKAAFDRISPLRHTENIKIPVYISAGEEDGTASSLQSKKLAKKLKSQGNRVKTFFPDTEGHGYFKTKNRLRLYTEIEAFLKKHL